MIILGIDPGFHITGFSVLKKSDRSVFLLDYGALRMSPSKHLVVRIHIFYDFFVEKVRQWHVTDIALETPFLGKNAQNFLKLGYLRGILYLIANQNSIKLHEFSPRAVKQSVTGFGGASKEQVAHVMKRLFPRTSFQDTLDVTDALAVTLCGLWRSTTAQRP